jgi:hypothetical protein
LKNESGFFLKRKTKNEKILTTAKFDEWLIFMTIALKEWNILDHLKTQEDIALYLEACFEEAGDDSNFIAQALNDVARAKL